LIHTVRVSDSLPGVLCLVVVVFVILTNGVVTVNNIDLNWYFIFTVTVGAKLALIGVLYGL